MTLIITTVSPLQVTMVGDRRLTAAGKVVDENAGKQGHWVSSDSSVLYGYTGLARARNFELSRFIADTLVDVAEEGNFAFLPMLSRLEVALTELFSTHHQLKAAVDKRTTIVFAGFMGNGDPVSAMVSNFEDFSSEEYPRAVADKEFIWSARRGNRNAGITASMCHAAGAYRPIGGLGLQQLNDLLLQSKSHVALRMKSIELIRLAAASELSGGTIGREYLSTYLPAPIDGQPPMPTVAFVSDAPRNAMPLLDQITTTGPGQCGVIHDVSIGSTDGSPVVFPRQPRNSRCVCGSGRKFKHCHGK